MSAVAGARVASGAMPFGLGIWEIVILLAVLALLFGVKGVPDVARRLGVGVREVKEAVAEVDPRRMLEAGGEEPKPQPQAQPKQEPKAQQPPAGDGPATS